MCVHGRRRYLPDLPILSIFEALPLSKLLKTGRVCPRFAQLQAEALANRKMLTIFVGENVDRKKQLYDSELFFDPYLDTNTTFEAEEEMAEYSALELKTLNEEMVNWLKSTFPRVTKLRVILGKDSELSDVIVYLIQLLEHWAVKLESVGIWGLFSSEIAEYLNLLQSLFSVINEKLHSLQSLTIAIPWDVKVSSILDLSFLGRLKLFSINIVPFGKSDQLFDSLNHQCALLENIPEIRLFGFSEPATLQVLSPRLSSKITALYSSDIVYRSIENGPQKDLSTQFPALKWYKQNGFKSDTNLGSFFISLSKLSHLKYIELLNVPFHSPQRFQFQQELPPLFGVKTLSISGQIQDHHFLSLLGPLDRLFPSLKTINLNVEMDYDSTEPSPIRERLPNGESRKSAFRSAGKLRMEETFGGLIRQFAQLELKGSLAVELFYQVFQENTGGVKFTYFYSYGEEFNFSDGVPMEDWQIKEENICDQADFDDSEEDESDDSEEDSDDDFDDY